MAWFRLEKFGETDDLSNDLLNERTENIDLKFIWVFAHFIMSLHWLLFPCCKQKHVLIAPPPVVCSSDNFNMRMSVCILLWAQVNPAVKPDLLHIGCENNEHEKRKGTWQLSVDATRRAVFVYFLITNRVDHHRVSLTSSSSSPPHEKKIDAIPPTDIDLMSSFRNNYFNLQKDMIDCKANSFSCRRWYIL